MAASGSLLLGNVLAVPSGDTLVVSAPVPNGIPPRKRIRLSNINAPRLGWKDRADEPFAWEARDALREYVIGKRVSFKIENSGGGNTEYGEVYLDGERVSEWVVGSGWAKVRDLRNQENADHVALKELESQASSAGRGIWTKVEGASEAAVHPIVMQRDGDHLALFEEVGGKPTQAIIESVRDGTSLRCVLLPSMQSITLLLCGARSPTFKKDKETGEVTAEPWAAAAQYFVELRLLNRKLDIILEVPDERGNFFGTVVHPRGNIATSLLREGLAKYVDWSAAHVEYGPELKAAQKEAQSKQLRLWAGWTPPVATVDPNAAEFAAKVVEVISGDMLVIAREDGSEQTVYLASVRAPRFRRKDRSEPWGYEARERLRKLTIGKVVQVTLEYVRTPSADAANQTPRTYVTIVAGGKNVAARLLSEGLAKAMRHRDDDERSHQYDALMAAEVGANKAGRGMHTSDKKAGAPHIRSDASGDAAKAKLLAEQMRGSVTGVVEHIINGARFKVFLPSENVVVSFGLAHVRAPRHDSRNPEAAEPFGLESMLYARKTLLHREVKLEVETTDKRGTFIGNLFINKDNFALGALTDGLAYMSGRYADRSPYFELMNDAQAEAKATKRGYWATYVEPKPKVEAKDDDDAAESSGPKLYDVVLTEIIDATQFYLQVLGKPSEQLGEFMTAFAEAHASYSGPGVESMGKLKAGAFVSAQFTVDNAWYRAKIEEVHDDGDVTVRFIDYGNAEKISTDRLRPITDAQMELAPQAHKASLALVKPPQDSDLKAEADAMFADAYLGIKLRAKVEYKVRSTNEWFVSLYSEIESETDGEDPDVIDIASEILAAGLGYIAHKDAKTKAKKAIIKRLAPFEQEAKDAHAGIWMYGDVDFDEPDAPIG